MAVKKIYKREGDRRPYTRSGPNRKFVGFGIVFSGLLHGIRRSIKDAKADEKKMRSS